jgi:hypothetical protein
VSFGYRAGSSEIGDLPMRNVIQNRTGTVEKQKTCWTLKIYSKLDSTQQIDLKPVLQSRCVEKSNGEYWNFKRQSLDWNGLNDNVGDMGDKIGWHVFE